MWVRFLAMGQACCFLLPSGNWGRRKSDREQVNQDRVWGQGANTTAQSGIPWRHRLWSWRGCVLGRSVMSNSSTPWTVPTRLPCPWSFPGKNTGVRCQALLWGILPSLGLSQRPLGLLRWQAGSVPLVPSGSLNVKFSLL